MCVCVSCVCERLGEGGKGGGEERRTYYLGTDSVYSTVNLLETTSKFHTIAIFVIGDL